MGSAHLRKHDQLWGRIIRPPLGHNRTMVRSIGSRPQHLGPQEAPKAPSRPSPGPWSGCFGPAGGADKGCVQIAPPSRDRDHPSHALSIYRGGSPPKMALFGPFWGGPPPGGVQGPLDPPSPAQNRFFRFSQRKTEGKRYLGGLLYIHQVFSLAEQKPVFYVRLTEALYRRLAVEGLTPI